MQLFCLNVLRCLSLDVFLLLLFFNFDQLHNELPLQMAHLLL